MSETRFKVRYEGEYQGSIPDGIYEVYAVHYDDTDRSSYHNGTSTPTRFLVWVVDSKEGRKYWWWIDHKYCKLVEPNTSPIITP